MLNINGVSEGEFLEYNGRPLVRQDNHIYYGDLTDGYHVCMMIMADRDSDKGEGQVPDTIVVQLFAKDAKFPEKQSISKGLADAFETADAWLERYNK